MTEVDKDVVSLECYKKVCRWLQVSQVGRARWMGIAILSIAVNVAALIWVAL